MLYLLLWKENEFECHFRKAWRAANNTNHLILSQSVSNVCVVFQLTERLYTQTELQGDAGASVLYPAEWLHHRHLRLCRRDPWLAGLTMTVWLVPVVGGHGAYSQFPDSGLAHQLTTPQVVQKRVLNLSSSCIWGYKNNLSFFFFSKINSCRLPVTLKVQ